MKRFLLIYILSFILFAGITNNTLAGQSGQDTSLTVSQPAGFELNIYPNPVENGRLNLEITNDNISSIRLIDIAGKDILISKMEYGISKTRLDLHDLQNGIYFIKVKTTSNKIYVRKLIVSSR